MEKFLERYNSKISGVISTFDRMIFKKHIMSFFTKKQETSLFISRGDFWIYTCSDSDVVPLSDSNLYQQT